MTVTRNRLAVAVRAFALGCLAVRGLAVDPHERATLTLMGAAATPAGPGEEAPLPTGLLDVLGTSMTYLPATSEPVPAPGGRPAFAARSDPRPAAVMRDVPCTPPRA